MSANPITSTLAALLENAAGTALNLDPAARSRIAELDEQVLLLELSILSSSQPSTDDQRGTPNAALRVICSAAGGGTLTIMADSEHNTRAPNAIVRGSVANFMQALLPATGHDLPDGIEIEGDERLLMALQDCFRNLQPNWREPLESFIATVSQRFGGSSAAPGAPPVLQDLLGQAELAFATLRTAFSDALEGGKDSAASTSSRFWAQGDDVEDFATRLENLQMNVDRLRAELDVVDTSEPKRSELK